MYLVLQGFFSSLSLLVFKKLQTMGVGGVFNRLSPGLKPNYVPIVYNLVNCLFVYFYG